MKNGLILLHYGIINIIFIDCLINTVYKPNTITKRTVIMDAIKCILYLFTIIYSYKINWFLGMLIGSISFIIGLIFLCKSSSRIISSKVLIPEKCASFRIMYMNENMMICSIK